MLTPFGVSVTSDEMAVRTALNGIITGLRPLCLDVEEVGTVELVMAEVINNIVEHAYPPNSPGGPIRVTCHHKIDGLHLTIRDEGKAMPDGQAPLGTVPNLQVDLMDMPEGGFGWFLIRDLAKEVSYRRSGNENQLDFRLAIAIPRAN